MSFIGKILHFYMERTAGKLSLDELCARLQTAAVPLAVQMDTASDTPANRERAGHVIGIERWSQRRLRTLLGEALLIDEYDSYRPAAGQSLKALGAFFKATRQQTLDLVHELGKVSGVELKTVPHNEMGDLTVRGWLVYIQAHASREGQPIK